jgi:hypothetical protein
MPNIRENSHTRSTVEGRTCLKLSPPVSDFEEADNKPPSHQAIILSCKEEELQPYEITVFTALF